MLNRVQPHLFWKISTITCVFLFFSLLGGGLSFLADEPQEAFVIMCVIFGIATSASQMLATMVFRESLKAPTYVEEEMGLRNDIAALGEYSSLTGEFIKRVLPMLGKNMVSEVVQKHTSGSRLLQGCELTNGNLNIRPAVERLQVMDTAEGMRTVFMTFLALHSDLIDASEIMVSRDRAFEMFNDALSTTGKHYGERIYRYGLPLLLSRTLFEPALAACDDSVKAEINKKLEELSPEDQLLGKIRIVGNRLRLDDYYAALSQVEPEAMVERTILAFSRFAKVCASVAGGELLKRLEAQAQVLFSIIEKHPALAKYDLTRVLPKAVAIPGPLRALAMGKSVMIKEEKHERAFEIFSSLVKLGVPALCISSTYPDELRAKFSVEGAKILWISGQKTDFSVPPSNLDILRDTIDEFLQKNRGGVVLIDGLEYLVTINGFDTMLQFLHDIWSKVAFYCGRLIIPVNPHAFSPSQLTYLERNMETV
jgi:hypothetical protein